MEVENHLFVEEHVRPKGNCSTCMIGSVREPLPNLQLYSSHTWTSTNLWRVSPPRKPPNHTSAQTPRSMHQIASPSSPSQTRLGLYSRLHAPHVNGRNHHMQLSAVPGQKRSSTSSVPRWWVPRSENHTSQCRRRKGEPEPKRNNMCQHMFCNVSPRQKLAMGLVAERCSDVLYQHPSRRNDFRQMLTS